eukprot:SAG11_NODE_10_length_27955_cov_15.365235_5_plen_83_part_00
MAQLKAVVETCDTFVLIMDPWDSPVCFTRVWCLFEVLTAILSGRAIEVALPTAQIIDFIQDLCDRKCLKFVVAQLYDRSHNV